MRPAQSYSISSKYCHDKGTVKRRGLVVGGGGDLELSRGATVVRSSSRKESLSAFICHFLLLSWLH